MTESEAAQARVSFEEMTDLARESVGGKALLANDEFFAEKGNLLKPGRPVFVADRYTDRGKWMDGWETRRRREPGHDWCIVKLGIPGVIHGVEVDTSYFVGNFPEFCLLEACEAGAETKPEKLAAPGAQWTPILAKSRLAGGCRNLFAIRSEARCTHVRLNIFPDGGVARLRVYGEARPDWEALKASGEPVDLAAAEHGGAVVACNDMFFGPKDNLILPGRAATMGGGWETRRKRALPGHDWIVVRLGAAGVITKVEIDTSHFKGNYPESCALEAAYLLGVAGADADPQGPWDEILPRMKLKGDTRHFFEKELRAARSYTHVRLRIFPDGGISRLRVYGRPDVGA